MWCQYLTSVVDDACVMQSGTSAERCAVIETIGKLLLSGFHHFEFKEKVMRYYFYCEV